MCYIADFCIKYSFYSIFNKITQKLLQCISHRHLRLWNCKLWYTDQMLKLSHILNFIVTNTYTHGIFLISHTSYCTFLTLSPSIFPIHGANTNIFMWNAHLDVIVNMCIIYFISIFYRYHISIYMCIYNRSVDLNLHALSSSIKIMKNWFELSHFKR